MKISTVVVLWLILNIEETNGGDKVIEGLKGFLKMTVNGCFDAVPCKTITGKTCLPEYKLIDADNPNKYVSFIGCTTYGTKLGPSCAVAVDQDGMATIFEECDPSCRVAEIQTSFLSDSGGCKFGFMYDFTYIGACTNLDDPKQEMWCPTYVIHSNIHRHYLSMMKKWGVFSKPCPRFCHQTLKVPGFAAQTNTDISSIINNLSPFSMMPSPAAMMPPPAPLMPPPAAMMPTVSPATAIPMTSVGKYDRCFPIGATM